MVATVQIDQPINVPVGSDASGPLGDAIRVALVEDDPVMRARFCEVIRAAPGLRLLVGAASGHEMLAWLSDHEPDVLLVDLGLPDLSGIEVIVQARRRYPALDVAVVTMHEDDPNVFASLQAGAAGYVVKHAMPGEIPVVIRELHEGGAPMSPRIARRVLQRMRQAGARERAEPVPSALEVLEGPALLSPREVDILNLVARGLRYAEIAKVQGLSVHTVNSHLKSVYAKLVVHSKSEAVFEADRLGLLSR